MKELFNKGIRTSSRLLGTDTGYLARGSFWLASGTVIRMIVALGISFIIARYLPKELYGNYRYVLSLLGMAGILSLPRVGAAMTRAVARGYERTFQKASLIIFISSLGISIFSIGASAFFFLQGNEPVGWGMLIAGLLVPFVEGLGNWRGYLDGKKEFKKKTKYNLISQVFYGIAMTAAIGTIYVMKVDAPYNIILLVGSYFGAHAIPNIVFFWKTQRTVPEDSQHEPGALKYGMHLSLSSIPGTIATYIDSILLYNLLGPASLAIYSFAIVGPEQMKKFLSNVATVSFPKLAQRAKDNTDLKKTLPLKVFKATGLSVLAVIIYILIAPFAFKILFPRYMDSVLLSQIFSLSLALYPFSIFHTALDAEGDIKRIYIDRFIAPVAQIILIATFIPLYGLMGAVWARVIGRMINYSVAYVLFVSRKI